MKSASPSQMSITFSYPSLRNLLNFVSEKKKTPNIYTISISVFSFIRFICYADPGDIHQEEHGKQLTANVSSKPGQRL